MPHMVKKVTMEGSLLFVLSLFASLVAGQGNMGTSKTDFTLPKRDIKAFPACITDSDCASVTGSEGEVADFKCFQSMCFPWADKRLQGGQVRACSKAVDLTSHSTIIVLTWSTG